MSMKQTPVVSLLPTYIHFTLLFIYPFMTYPPYTEPFTDGFIW